MPKTEIIYTNIQIERALDGENVKGMSDFLLKLVNAARKVSGGSKSVFLKTGYISNKHDWKRSCYIEDGDDIAAWLSHVVNLVEMSVIGGITSPIPYDFWAIRELIPTKTQFTFFQDMPITTEVRYFVRDGKIECSHPYWDRGAFSGQVADEQFEKLETITDEDREELNEMATYVSRIFSGSWSVDFLKGSDGKWWMIDMAIGERSYHAEHKDA